MVLPCLTRADANWFGHEAGSIARLNNPKLTQKRCREDSVATTMNASTQTGLVAGIGTRCHPYVQELHF